jgi:SAM-dependent methyltransferase
MAGGSGGSADTRHPSWTLPPPVVPPEVYTEEYYRHDCGEAEIWNASDGRELGGIYYGMLDRIGFRPGQVLVDIGTGRGEILAAAVGRGAALAIGVEYARTAVTLADHTIEVLGVGDKAKVILADARSIPLDDGVADVVTMLDVVEHLAGPELPRAFAEVRRILRPGGSVHIHTLPTRTLYNVTYRLQRLARPSRWRRWPADPRQDAERLMHVNEQSLWSLRRGLRRAGFVDVRVEPGVWMYTDFVPDERARRLYRGLAKLPGARVFGAANLLAMATRP